MAQISRKEERRLDRERIENQKKRRKLLEKAAPELLAALETAKKEMETWRDLAECDCPENHFCGRPRLIKSIEIAKSAIRKARGE